MWHLWTPSSSLAWNWCCCASGVSLSCCTVHHHIATTVHTLTAVLCLSSPSTLSSALAGGESEDVVWRNLSNTLPTNCFASSSSLLPLPLTPPPSDACTTARLRQRETERERERVCVCVSVAHVVTSHLAVARVSCGASSTYLWWCLPEFEARHSRATSIRGMVTCRQRQEISQLPAL